jgi:Caspase domain
MKNKLHAKFITLVTLIICTALIVSPAYSTGLNAKGQLNRNNNLNLPKVNDIQINAGTEYWALLFAVGVYRNNPNQDRPSMLRAVDNLYDVLIDSPQWQSDHIHVVKGSQATGQNLIKELLWLIRSEDADDMSLIYITTHGSPLLAEDGYPIDIPPKDEADGADEILVMYDGFDNPYAFIWDDLLNFLLSLLQSQGVCLIVDSCFSGGFNDVPFKGNTIEDYTLESFSEGLAEEIATQGRVVLMSSEEDTYSYGSYFSNYLIDGFEGSADLSTFGNGDGINSAEESFYYAQRLVDLYGYGNQHPTILDLYPGEFPVTS